MRESATTHSVSVPEEINDNINTKTCLKKQQFSNELFFFHHYYQMKYYALFSPEYQFNESGIDNTKIESYFIQNVSGQ